MIKLSSKCLLVPPSALILTAHSFWFYYYREVRSEGEQPYHRRRHLSENCPNISPLVLEILLLVSFFCEGLWKSALPSLFLQGTLCMGGNRFSALDGSFCLGGTFLPPSDPMSPFPTGGEYCLIDGPLNRMVSHLFLVMRKALEGLVSAEDHVIFPLHLSLAGG